MPVLLRNQNLLFLANGTPPFSCWKKALVLFIVCHQASLYLTEAECGLNGVLVVLFRSLTNTSWLLFLLKVKVPSLLN